MTTLTYENYLEIQEFKRDYGRSFRWDEVASRYGFNSGEGIRSAFRRIREQMTTEAPQGTLIEVADQGPTITSPVRGRITSLEELLAEAKVDLAVWRVTKYIINKWEVGTALPDGTVCVEPLFQVKAWLAPLAPMARYIEAAESLKADMQGWTPPTYSAIPHPNASPGCLLEICISDLHLGMLSWEPEVGADYDTTIAEELFRNAILDILGMVSGFSIEEIVLVLGGDILHVDQTIAGAGGATNRGTPQDVDGRWQKAFRTARMMLVSSVELLRVVAPVKVVVVPGNHDLERLFHLGDVLAAWFREAEDVMVLNSPEPRKYVRWGRVLLGYCHEKLKDMGILMANEVPEMWAQTDHREWHTAHGHRAALEESGGVRIRTIPALVAENAWSAGRGYTHIRCAEAYLWHRDQAFMGMFSVPARRNQ